MSPNEERNWAAASHWGCIVSAWIALGFLCPLLVMLLKGQESTFVRKHAVESLNFQITVLIYLVISMVLVLVLVGILMLIALGILWIVAVVLASVRAAQGEVFRYPATIRFVR